MLDTTITNNYDTGYGGGVYAIGSAVLPALSSNQTIRNTTSGDGGESSFHSC